MLDAKLLTKRLIIREYYKDKNFLLTPAHKLSVSIDGRTCLNIPSGISEAMKLGRIDVWEGETDGKKTYSIILIAE